MVGWFDAVEKGHVLRHGGFDEMVINKIDVLTQTPELAGSWDGALKICSAYRLPTGEVSRVMPVDDGIRRASSAVYTICPGWSEDISQVRSFWSLPLNAQRYVATAYAATVVAAYGEERWVTRDLPRLRLVGVGPESSQVILDAPRPDQLMVMAGTLQ
jgi:adenylosuccinate synthase